MNKKAIESLYANTIALFVIILILLGLWFFVMYMDFTHQGTTKGYVISTQSATANKIQLINFLRTEIEFDINNDGINEKLTNADFIALSYQNKALEKEIEKKIDEFFTKFYGDTWKITIEHKNQKKEIGSTNWIIIMVDTSEAEQKIPSLDGEEIKIHLLTLPKNTKESVKGVYYA